MATRLLTASSLAWLLCSTSAWAADQGWRVTETRGAVLVESHGARRVALGDMAVAPGDLVTTGGDGRAVLTHGQDFVFVSPNSRVRISEPRPDGITQIFEDVGSALFKIEKKGAPHFTVQTPYLAAVVKGTTFSVNVTDVGASVQVVEGAVQVSPVTGNATQLVTPGMIGMVERRQPQQLVVDTGGEVHTLGAPAQAAPPAPAGSTEAPADSDRVAPAPTPTPVSVTAEAAPPVAPPAPAPTVVAATAEAPVSLAQVSNGLVSGVISAAPVSNNRSAVETETAVEAAVNGPRTETPTPSETPTVVASNSGSSGGHSDGGTSNSPVAGGAGSNGGGEDNKTPTSTGAGANSGSGGGDDHNTTSAGSGDSGSNAGSNSGSNSGSNGGGDNKTLTSNGSGSNSGDDHKTSTGSNSGTSGAGNNGSTGNGANRSGNSGSNGSEGNSSGSGNSGSNGNGKNSTGSGNSGSKGNGDTSVTLTVSTPLTGNVSIGAGLTTSGKGNGHKTDTNND